MLLPAWFSLTTFSGLICCSATIHQGAKKKIALQLFSWTYFLCFRLFAWRRKLSWRWAAFTSSRWSPTRPPLTAVSWKWATASWPSTASAWWGWSTACECRRCTTIKRPSRQLSCLDCAVSSAGEESWSARPGTACDCWWPRWTPSLAAGVRR